MLKIEAKRLLQYTTEQLWDILEGPFILVFEDGELQTNARETCYSSYAWDFHRQFPDTPILMKHHVNFVLKGKRLSSGTHLTLFGNVLWSVHDTYIQRDYSQGDPQNQVHFRDLLAEIVYRLINRMYNDLSYRLEEFVASVDILDFLNISEHPRIKEATSDELEPTRENVDNSYAVVRDVVMNSSDFNGNMLVLAAKSGLIKFDQFLQCMAVRGYLTDTNSNQFKTPVMRNYFRGLRKFYDSLVESRSAAKALLFSKAPLQDAEYFSRRLQLMCQVVHNLHIGDCGSTEYIHWHVRKRQVELGNVLSPGDLPQLAGKYYLTDEGVLKAIKASDEHLIGKTIKLRSVLHCKHPDPYGICSTCFGQLAESVPADTNIGQMTCTSLAQKTSQNVLSVKHLDNSATIAGIILAPEAKKYLKVSTDENSYVLSEYLIGKDVKLIIPSVQASSLTDIMEVERVEDLNITRISELTEIGFQVTENGILDRLSIPVNINRRLASMTYPLLNFIRKHGWGIDEFGNYIVDLKGYNWNEPILTLPLKHFNMSDHSAEISMLLESSVSKMQERDHNASPDAMIVELFDLVNSKLNVNLAVLETVLYASTVVSIEDGNYDLPKPWTKRNLGVMTLTMTHRSLSAAMAFEKHHETLLSPSSYIETNRVEHPFDRLLLPDQVQRFD